jgi:tetratricopeptide (TPR) repeat protein
VARPLSVRPLAREDAIKFLLERTAQSDRAAANDLAEELGDLPLALEQAGAYIETIGSDHPTVAIRVHNLALVLEDLGDLQQARKLYERSLSIIRQFLGDDHPNTRAVRRNLELLIEKMNGE